ncbi:phytanoyl-CoA dioxygenase family protein [Mucilaginibacter sp. X4EP1]|uniref:phytanoyl-CoA dioxygenase family protein n=1 Tax=Mucilaginibacter sp. X4EP1 TaxID=2723092 RepID=UPI0021686778|nr:phytanoyl-CoA dioxygenase family protein [Mucilaginibacter sp. X4EP1]MCS3812579.1 ectoine hydroxylase-related dioxygenase (phytanoyl-CoA dioxygenase family) [Mucilaginibacter sp. X4EP1]
MVDLTNLQQDLINNGFTIVNEVFNDNEVNALIDVIDNTDQSDIVFRKTDDLFAIRRFLKEIPDIDSLVFTDNLKSIIKRLFGNDYFVVKSIYFDKPEKSNWFVAWHQDLTISVDKKIDVPDYGPWTVKPNQYAVQPPVQILEDNFTVRIHLDDTDEGNGALKVIPGSHLKGIYRTENINWDIETENICKVKAGGIMIMRPLLMHASNRTTTNKKRRVIHIEFSRAVLPDEINWSEKTSY